MKVMPPEIESQVSIPSQTLSPIGKIIIEPDSANPQELDFSAINCNTVDGDFAGAAQVSLADKFQIIKPNTDVLIEAGYGSSTLKVYRGKVEEFNEEPLEPERRDCGLNESVKQLLERPIITTRYDEDELGVDGLHTGQWTRSEVVTDICKRHGVEIDYIEPTTKEVIVNPFINESIADIFARIIQPEFMKARINEDNKLVIRKARNSGEPDIIIEEGVNLADLNPPRYSKQDIINEVLVIGASKEEVQVAHPPAEIFVDRQKINPGEEISKTLQIPRAVFDNTLLHELRVFETVSYDRTTVETSQSWLGEGSFILEFLAPTNKPFLAVKDVVINTFYAAGETSWINLVAINADGTATDIISTTRVGTLNSFALDKPIRALGIRVSAWNYGRRGLSLKKSWTARTAVFSINVSFTPMTEREQYESPDSLRFLTVAAGAGGGHPASRTFYSPVGTSSGWTVTDIGAAHVGEILSQRIDERTSEIRYGIDLESTWLTDAVEVEITVRGRLWSTVRPKVLYFASRNEESISLYGTKQIVVENEAISDEEEALEIAENILAAASGPVEEWTFVASGQPQAEPGDLVKLKLHRPDWVARFGAERLLYVLSPTNILQRKESGGLTYATTFKCIPAENSALSVYRNLGISLTKERSEIQADYLASFILCRIEKIVKKNPSTQETSSVLPRTDANLYDVVLLTEQSKIIKSVPNSGTEAYIERDTAFIMFENGDRAKPWLVGRADRLFVLDDDTTRSGPPPDDPTLVTRLTIEDDPIPAAVLDEPYSHDFYADGGLGESFIWDIPYGTIPPGMTLEQDGTRTARLNGPARAVGIWKFALRVHDNLGNIDVEDFTIEVNPVSIPEDLAAPTCSIINPIGGEVISGLMDVDIHATDDVGVIRVDLLIDGNLAGYKLAEPFNFDIDTQYLTNDNHTLLARAYDAAGHITSSLPVIILTNNVLSGQFAIVTDSLPQAEKDAFFSAEIYAAGGSYQRFTWSLISGALPDGLSFDTSSTPSTILQGTVTAVGGDYAFRLRVVDSLGNVAEKDFVITVVTPITMQIVIDKFTQTTWHRNDVMPWPPEAYSIRCNSSTGNPAPASPWVSDISVQSIQTGAYSNGNVVARSNPIELDPNDSTQRGPAKLFWTDKRETRAKGILLSTTYYGLLWHIIDEKFVAGVWVPNDEWKANITSAEITFNPDVGGGDGSYVSHPLEANSVDTIRWSVSVTDEAAETATKDIDMVILP